MLTPAWGRWAGSFVNPEGIVGYLGFRFEVGQTMAHLAQRCKLSDSPIREVPTAAAVLWRICREAQ